MAKSSKRKRAVQKQAVPAPTPAPAAPTPPQPRWKSWPRVLLILLAGLWIYAPVLNGWELWDDGLLIFHNPLMSQPDRLAKAWFQPGSFIDYYPLQQSVQWFEWYFWRNWTTGYHVTNLALHVTSALLVWGLLARLGLRLAWLGGLIFAVHPALVESVAWMAELKNTLSLPPFLLAMSLYLDFERTRSRRAYGLSVTMFLVAMLCKTTMTTFPFALLLYAWWKRGRIARSDLLHAAPYLAISLILGLVSWWLQEFAAIGHDYIPIGGLDSRIALIGMSTAFYFTQCVAPVNLLPIYPQWHIKPPTPEQFLPWPVFAFVGWILWEQRRSWGRPIILGLGFFLVMIAPFTGVAMGSYMTSAWVMDHFVYIPIIGLIGLFVAGLDHLQSLLPRRSAASLMALVGVVTGMLAMVARNYAEQYHDSERLWNYELQFNTEAWEGYNDLATALYYRGAYGPAVPLFRRALEINPLFLTAMNNLGLDLRAQGRYGEAADVYRQAIALAPDNAEEYTRRGDALANAGRKAEAEATYQECEDRFPVYPEGYYALGTFYMKDQRVLESIGQFREAVSFKPDYYDAWIDLGIALGISNDLAGAQDAFSHAVRLNPQNARGHYNLALALNKAGHPQDAEAELREALRLSPHYELARDALKRIEAGKTGPLPSTSHPLNPGQKRSGKAEADLPR